MKYSDAKRVRESWGDKPCDHPFGLERELMDMITDLGYVEPHTGDYVCRQCGRAFTKEEKDNM